MKINTVSNKFKKNYEIESKFSVDQKKLLDYLEDTPKSLLSSFILEQGYFKDIDNFKKRMRLIDRRCAIKTKKGRDTFMNGFVTREEVENTVDYKEGLATIKNILDSGPIIIKKRHKILFEEQIFEVDIFLNVNDNNNNHKKLILAEFEIKDNSLKYSLPNFLIDNVTLDPQYKNTNIIKKANNYDFDSINIELLNNKDCFLLNFKNSICLSDFVNEQNLKKLV